MCSFIVQMDKKIERVSGKIVPNRGTQHEFEYATKLLEALCCL